MGLLTLLGYLVLLGITGFVIFLFYRNWKFSKYFGDKRVPYLGAGLKRLGQFLTGRMTLPEAELLLYEEALAGGGSIVGFNDSFISPAFFVTDLELARHIYIKDFDHFVNRREFTSRESDQLFTKMLIGLESDQWKGMRAKLSPTFTTGKIRRMFGIFDNSSQKMCEYLKEQVGASGGDFDICEAYSKFAMDVIASCAFGINSKSFDIPNGSKSEFELMGTKLQLRFTFTVFVRLIFTLMVPKVADALGVEAFDRTPINYFVRVIKEVMTRRRETGERQDDFLQLMMDAQKGLLKGEENSKETLEVMTGTDDAIGEITTTNTFANNSSGKLTIIDDDDIAANCVLFLLAGFDTTQSLLIFAAYQLALEQEMQQKLYEEVKSSLDANGGKLTYEGVHDMSYLDMFVNETLRYFPPAPRTERKCTKDYTIPGTDIVINKGVLVSLPVIGMHRDPKYYENPDKFNPDRFLPENKSDRHPYAFAPFGHGPRNCIGMRFALTEAKTVIATLIYRFKLEPCGRTDIPIKYSNTTSLKPANGMWLKISAR